MTKKHWNSIEINGTIPLNIVKSLIDHSYKLVVSKMPKSRQRELEE